MPRYLNMTSELAEYTAAHSIPASEAGRRLVVETTRLFPEVAMMQVDPVQGAFLAWLVKVTGARRILEIGTFTGMSSLCMAEALGEDGEITCCDISEEYTALARQAWTDAGVAERVTLLLGPALETLADLEGPFDLAFVDADKTNYPRYLERLMELVRPGGVIVADNTLWSGRVADPSENAPDTEGLRRFNALAADSPDLEVVVLPFADGVTVMRRC